MLVFWFSINGNNWIFAKTLSFCRYLVPDFVKLTSKLKQYRWDTLYMERKIEILVRITYYHCRSPTVWFNRSGVAPRYYSFLLLVLQQKSINFVSRWNCTFRCREWLFEQIDNFRKSNSIAWGQFASSSVRPLIMWENLLCFKAKKNLSELFLHDGIVHFDVKIKSTSLKSILS